MMDEPDVAIDNLEQDDSFEEHSHRACYIFKPTDLEDDDFEDQQPAKRRKITKTTHASEETWPKLLNGNESTAQAAGRQQLFTQFWEQRQLEIDEILEGLDETPLLELEQFVSESDDIQHDGRIPTALLVPDRHSQNQSKAIERLKQTINSKLSANVLIELPPRQCPNLQLALKTLIKSVLTQVAGADGYIQFHNRNKTLHTLPFDLELLQLFRAQHKPESRIVLYLDSAEEFDGQTFNELIRTLHSWSDRIPFVLLLGITTTVSLFESRLPKATIRCLRAREFAFQAPNNLETRLLDVFQQSNTFLGPDIVKAVHDTISSQTSTILSITAMIKHAYMAHFYTNPLSVLLDLSHAKPAEIFDQDVMKIVAKAIRNNRPFQRYVEGSISERQNTKAHLSDMAELLANDESLLGFVEQHITRGQQSYHLACSMATVLTSIHSALHGNQIESTDAKQRPRSPLDLYADLYSNLDDMTQSSTFHEIEQILSRSHSKRDFPVELQHLRRDEDTSDPTTTDKLLQIVLGSTTPQTSSSSAAEADILIDLKGTEDITSLLSKAGPNLPERLRHITRFASCDLTDDSMFMRDVFIIRPSVTSTTKAAFRPRIRYAIERALSTPEDYLGTYVQPDVPAPPAAVLFGLLQEAPQTINVRDLYDAFASRMNENTNADADGEDGDEKRSKATMALFYRALSELRMIGLVKSSSGTVVKRKSAKGSAADVDFIAKTSWAGL